MVLIPTTFTLNKYSMAALISGFFAFGFTSNVNWLFSSAIVAFSVMIGRRIKSASARRSVVLVVTVNLLNAVDRRCRYNNLIRI